MDDFELLDRHFLRNLVRQVVVVVALAVGTLILFAITGCSTPKSAPTVECDTGHQLLRVYPNGNEGPLVFRINPCGFRT